MSHDFHVLYNIETNIAEAIGGSPFDKIPEGMRSCLAREKDGQDFLTNKKVLRDYIVIVVNGYAEFKFRSSNLEFPRNVVSDQSIRDLHHRVVFFDYLNIQYTVNNGLIVFEFNPEKLDEKYKFKFDSIINEKNKMFNLYITNYNEPNELISIQNIDIYQLGIDKTYEIELNVDKKISIWGSKKI
jgi:hypothetical protein